MTTAPTAPDPTPVAVTIEDLLLRLIGKLLALDARVADLEKRNADLDRLWTGPGGRGNPASG